MYLSKRGSATIIPAIAPSPSGSAKRLKKAASNHLSNRTLGSSIFDAITAAYFGFDFRFLAASLRLPDPFARLRRHDPHRHRDERRIYLPRPERELSPSFLGD